jgi:transposase
MDYFAGLDISMDETHVCVLDREGVVVHESKTASTADAIAGELAKAPSCRRIVFETGRMVPILFHGLSQLGLPVVCVESRQAYQALKSLATHKTDRNEARGLAHAPIPSVMTPDRRAPRRASDGRDRFGLGDEFPPSVASGVDDGVVVFEDAVG